MAVWARFSTEVLDANVAYTDEENPRDYTNCTNPYKESIQATNNIVQAWKDNIFIYSFSYLFDITQSSNIEHNISANNTMNKKREVNVKFLGIRTQASSGVSVQQSVGSSPGRDTCVHEQDT